MSFQTELKKPSMSFQAELKTPHVIPGRIEKMGHFFNSDPESTDISAKVRTSEHHSPKSHTFQAGRIEAQHVIPDRIEAPACHSGQN
ncbi:hypothetical protein QUF72_10990 [Desulfobacterales bacterium HSG2]|nr:hypothetical protein [Desulfobacterales bacterium HSG2]